MASTPPPIVHPLLTVDVEFPIAISQYDALVGVPLQKALIKTCCHAAPPVA
jgi:hypothetical protein